MKTPETSLQVLSSFPLPPTTPKRACSQAIIDRLSTKQNGKQLLHFRTSCGKYSDFSDCFINFGQKSKCPNTRVFIYNRVFWHVPQVQCSRLCIISKSVVIVFDDRSDVSQKTMKVTVPSYHRKMVFQ